MLLVQAVLGQWDALRGPLHQALHTLQRHLSAATTAVTTTSSSSGGGGGVVMGAARLQETQVRRRSSYFQSAPS
jgi:7-keto-8-aminopelargonate synthetase-like enzyme